MRALGFFAALMAVVAVGACGSGGGFNDDGGLGDGSGGDATSDGSKDSSKNDTGLFDSTTGDGSDDGSTDATFNFDGFGKGDSNYCFDDDFDGWTTCQGDCNDHDSLINPCAFDTNDPNDAVGIDGIDNDCDGTVDNVHTCDGSLTAGHDTTASHYAAAMNICDNAKCTVVVGATFYGPNNSYAHRITKQMGTNSNFAPHKGTFMAFLSSGTADDDVDTSTYTPGDGTNLKNTYTHPDPLKAINNVNPCGTGKDEPTTVNDYSELRLTLKAPINAGSFTFDFNFFSEEYPEYVCHGFNDTFLAELTSKQYTTPYQIAFDTSGHRINVNNAFFQDCTTITTSDNLGYTHTCTGALTLLTKTGYELKYGQTSFTLGNGNKGSGATDWLKTTAPIQPGEQFTLSFIIFDEGDGLMDTAINLDNFRWSSTTISTPVTAR